MKYIVVCFDRYSVERTAVHITEADTPRGAYLNIMEQEGIDVEKYEKYNDFKVNGDKGGIDLDEESWFVCPTP